jgi:hypothetical protein
MDPIDALQPPTLPRVGKATLRPLSDHHTGRARPPAWTLRCHRYQRARESLTLTTNMLVFETLHYSRGRWRTSRVTLPIVILGLLYGITRHECVTFKSRSDRMHRCKAKARITTLLGQGLVSNSGEVIYYLYHTYSMCRCKRSQPIQCCVQSALLPSSFKRCERQIEFYVMENRCATAFVVLEAWLAV